jgi:hypothetical protein
MLTLANGHGIDLLDPQPADVDFSSYAEQLAKEARFNGATPGVAYSVAEHLVRRIASAPRTSGDRQLAAYWSLHDAHEAVLKDDTTPKKCAIAELCAQQLGILAEHVLAAFDRLTDRHDAAIHAAAGLPWPLPADVAAQVKAWDRTLFVTEWRDLMGARAHPDWTPYRDVAPLPETIRPWPWPFARLALQVRWRRLLPALAPIEQAV